MARSPKARTRPKPRFKQLPPKPVGGWDVNRLVVQAGGPEALRVAHAGFGFKRLTPAQISNWKTRYTIPSSRLAELFVTLQSIMGEANFDPLDFLKVEASKR